MIIALVLAAVAGIAVWMASKKSTGFSASEKAQARALLLASGTSSAEVEKILAQAVRDPGMSTDQWVQQVAASWDRIPGNVTGGATAMELALEGIVPDSGAQGQALYQTNLAVLALPGGAQNAEFRSYVEQGLSAQQALDAMSAAADLAESVANNAPPISVAAGDFDEIPAAVSQDDFPNADWESIQAGTDYA